jgi:pimeloyl-ACP methyl ester carboxylesterase
VRLRNFFISLLGLLVVTAAALAFWAMTPLTVDRSEADPAVLVANADGDGVEPFTEGYFEYEGRSLHYVEAGDGEETIVFLHGFASFWFSHIRQMEALKSEYRVIAIDGLGAGRSDAPTDVEAYRFSAMAEHVRAFIDHLGEDKIHIVGHDLGAGLAIGFSMQYPERVHTVTGMSAPPLNVLLDLIQSDNQHRETFAYVERFKQANPVLLLFMRAGRQLYSSVHEPLVMEGKLSVAEGKAFQNATGNPKRINAHLNWYRANIPAPDDVTEDDYFPARGARLLMPALFIWGSEDVLISRKTISALEASADDIEFLELEGVGHRPHIEEPESVTNAIQGHIAR